MHDVLQEDETQTSVLEKYIGLSYKTLIIISLIVVGVGVYLGILLFGENSLEAYIQLQNYHENLEEKVESLKEENAGMQKEYFELQEITGE